MTLFEELDALSSEIAARKKVVSDAWKATLPDPKRMRGECNTPEMRALREEEKRRFGEILEKYKNKDN